MKRLLPVVQFTTKRAWCVGSSLPFTLSQIPPLARPLSSALPTSLLAPPCSPLLSSHLLSPRSALSSPLSSPLFIRGFSDQVKEDKKEGTKKADTTKNKKDSQLPSSWEELELFLLQKFPNAPAGSVEEEASKLRRSFFENFSAFSQSKESDVDMFPVNPAIKVALRELKEVPSAQGKQIPMFEWSPDPNDFPHDGPGKVVFERFRGDQSFVHQQADFILERKAMKGGETSHYFRGAPGAGKTVFLKMLGIELQNRGCSVYFIEDALELDDYDREQYQQLAELAKDQTVVLLIDEVHRAPNSRRWTLLLRTLKRSLIVVGVGIKRVGVKDPSPSFRIKHHASEMLLTEADVPQVTKHWIGTRSARGTVHTRQTVHQVCELLLAFTAGHLFPFTRLAQYLFTQDKVSLHDLDEVNKHLFSQEFNESEVMEEINSRCFEAITHVDLIDVAREVFLGGPSVQDLDKLVEPLDAMAFWDPNCGWFLSELLMRRAYFLGRRRSLMSNREAKLIDEKVDWEVNAEEIVLRGLEVMGPEDFESPHGYGIPVEDVIGVRWGIRVEDLFRNLYPSPFYRIPSTTKGSPPIIDWYFDTRLKMAVEVIRNGRPGGTGRHGLNSKFEKFAKGGSYSRFGDRFIVLNFEMERDTPTMPTVDTKHLDRLFTFVHRTNRLYRGDQPIPIAENVVKALRGIPSHLPDLPSPDE